MNISISAQELLLKGMVSEFTKNIFQEIKPLFKELASELEFFFNNGLNIYLENQQNKFSFVKTFLHRSRPIYLYEIYQPIFLENDNKTICTDSVKNLFKETNFITIIGDAGSGKSTLLKHLFLNSINETYCIPFLLELRLLKTSDTLEKYILNNIGENKITLNENILRKLLNRGQFIFFIDGFDEIKSENKTNIIENLVSFIQNNPDNKYILTSRPYSNVELLPFFTNYTIKKFNIEEIKSFINKQIKEDNLAIKIITSIIKGKQKFIKEFLSNPLLLSLYILTFQSNSTIPNKKFIFYRRVLDVLFSEHDSLSKIGFERERCSNLGQDQFEAILQRFSFISYFENVYNFHKDYLDQKFNLIKKNLSEAKFDNKDLIYDLKQGIGLWVEDGGLFSFAHRSLQEYFAALYLKNLNDANKEKVYQKILDNIMENSANVKKKVSHSPEKY